MSIQELNSSQNPSLRFIHGIEARESLVNADDQQLLERFIISKDEAAFETLLDRHGSMVLSVCRLKLSNHADIEDAFQATFLALATKCRSIRKRDSIRSWLYGTAFRCASTDRRKANRRQKHERQAPAMSLHEVPNEAELRDLQPVIDKEIEELPQQLRAAVEKQRTEGLKDEEAAQQLHCSVSAFRYRLTLALKLLRTRLGKRGIALSMGALSLALSQNIASADVPTALREATLRAATVAASGQALGGAIPASVLAILNPVLRNMWIKVIVVRAIYVLVVLGTLTSTGSVCYILTQPPSPPSIETTSPAISILTQMPEPVPVPTGRIIRVRVDKDVHPLKDGDLVDKTFVVEGEANLPESLKSSVVLYLAVAFVDEQEGERFWIKPDRVFVGEDGKWRHQITEPKSGYSLVLLAANVEIQQLIEEWFRECEANNSWPAIKAERLSAAIRLHRIDSLRVR